MIWWMNNLLNSNWEEHDHDFVSFLKLEKSQAAYICEQTKKQSNWRLV